MRNSLEERFKDNYFRQLAIRQTRIDAFAKFQERKEIKPKVFQILDLKSKKRVSRSSSSGRDSVTSAKTKKVEKQTDEIVDGFCIPIANQRGLKSSKSGQAYIKSNQGFFKPSFIVLSNSELYIYPDKDSKKHKYVFFVGQDMGIFIKRKDKCSDK